VLKKDICIRNNHGSVSFTKTGGVDWGVLVMLQVVDVYFVTDMLLGMLKQREAEFHDYTDKWEPGVALQDAVLGHTPDGLVDLLTAGGTQGWRARPEVVYSGLRHVAVFGQTPN